MLKNDRSELDYWKLVKKARRLQPGGGAKLRIALLADVSTQHLVPLLRVLLAGNGFDAEIYEAGYDTIELEAYDPASGLYASEPEFVVVLQAIAKVKEAFYQSTERRSFAHAQGSRIEQVWNAIRSRSQATILQSTFVVPFERASGNYGLRVPDSLENVVRELNADIAERARGATSVLVNDVEHLAAWVGRRQFVDEKLWALSKSLCALECLPDVAQNLVDLILAARGRAVKCVVLDLDNTLWGGVVGDDGLDGIELGDTDPGGAFRSLQLYLRELGRRGILLAVCSKNDDAVARRVFREHPGMVLKEEHIAVFVANWDDKATNLRRIRETLNIGFDSMVFLDDNPFERNLVRQLVPGVIVPELPEDPALYLRAISELNLFETAAQSELDARRGELYRDQELREQERVRFNSIEEYLRSLQTAVLFRNFRPQDLGRIAQLLQRSNQFNLTTRRYSEAQCAALMSDDAAYAFTVTVQDRFGDFGLVNIVILRKLHPVLEIDAFLMSCRVLQRGVEQYAMNKVFEYARRHGFDLVRGRYIPTAKNGMVAAFFEQFGFARVAASEAEGSTWELATDAYRPREVFAREVLDDAVEGS